MMNVAHQVENDPMLLALGGSRITQFGARNGYKLVHEENTDTPGMKIIFKRWQRMALAVEGAAVERTEYELILKTKGKRHRFFFQTLDGARALFRAVQAKQWDLTELPPLPQKAAVAESVGVNLVQARDGPDDGDSRHNAAGAEAGGPRTVAAADKTPDSSTVTLTKSLVDSQNLQRSGAADTSYQLCYEHSMPKPGSVAWSAVDQKLPYNLNHLTYMDLNPPKTQAASWKASCLAAMPHTVWQNPIKTASSKPTAAPNPASSAGPARVSPASSSVTASLPVSNICTPRDQPSTGLVSSRLSSFNVNTTSPANSLLPGTNLLCGLDQQQTITPADPSFGCITASDDLPSNPFGSKGLSSLKLMPATAPQLGELSIAGSSGVVSSLAGSRVPSAAVKGLLAHCHAPGAVVPNKPRSGIARCTGLGMAAPSIGAHLGSAVEAVLTGTWQRCQQALAQAAAVVTTSPSLSAAVSSAVTAASIAAQSVATLGPTPGFSPSSPTPAASLAQQNVLSPVQVTGTYVYGVLAQALSAVAVSAVIPEQMAVQRNLFLGCSVALWQECSLPVLQQVVNNNIFTVGREIGQGGFGRVCELLGSSGHIVPDVVVKIFSGSDGEFDDAETLNEMYHLKEHTGRKGIVQMLGAGVLAPGMHSQSGLEQTFNLRPVFCVVLERMDTSLGPMIAASRGFTVLNSLCIFKQLLLVLRDLHSQPEVVYAHRDIKGHNVLMKELTDSQGATKYTLCLGDLGGMASYQRGSGQRFSDFCGTVEYMAPALLKIREQGKLAETLEGLLIGNAANALQIIQYDETVDIWAAMMTLLDMLTGLPCAGEHLLVRPIRCEADISEHALDQLQRLVTGELQQLGSITSLTFKHYQPVLEQLFPAMSGLFGQDRCSTHQLLPIVDSLIESYRAADPSCDEMVVCL